MNDPSRRPQPPATSTRVVVLNASFELLTIVTVPRAVTFVLLDKAEVVAVQQDRLLRSAGGYVLAMPTVIRLVRYVKVPHSRGVPVWTRQALMRRDGNRCAYCRRHGATVEHIVPVSRGGRSTWLNTVVACAPCNNRKADRTPAEAGMALLVQPSVPSAAQWWQLRLVESERVQLSELGLVA